MRKREYSLIGICVLLVAALALVLFRNSTHKTNPKLSGSTMGTSYTIQIAERVSIKKLNALLPMIEAELAEVNRQMSTWDPESEISRFNHSDSTDPISVSEPFAEVVRRALELSKESNGTFDPTLEPLLTLWGFSSESTTSEVPSEEEILKAKALTGWHKISVPSTSSLQKSEPQISLDLGAIAKGYGVDAVSNLLLENGFKNWYVEIGGELQVYGKNSKGEPWKIGVQYPSPTAEFDRLKGTLQISSGALATSGDYRNYIEEDGQIFSHILDPRTGRSVHSTTASVSVYAPDCTLADGMATGLFVMGPEEGLAWVEQTPNVEALFLLRGEKGEIIEKFSSGFLAATGYIPLPEDKSR
ncbi:MAG: FAD:protein FMN transferase [Lentisphaerae bacterium]|nr:FAD:protein FMN transferase [Lentisphaerota bacterium]